MREDVLNGYVSAEAAQRHYGMEIDPDTFEVEAVRTESLRAAMRKAAGHNL